MNLENVHFVGLCCIVLSCPSVRLFFHLSVYLSICVEQIVYNWADFYEI